ncbi:Threonine/homoserine/homoserine lactone efflux protein [Sulfitobacter marinus]|uniref:Threonine/homoserine/homoserine lactone efflux protein n=1 Tax=Sulfitobacter marinus TaxID=394264 RepID=A0A1I6S2D8_9RHOB|nr:LysE family translocator [Sulfitobacter marinus]SFS71089.1 Threonine/homoserine/homoserine lactone efflux protein [Sulfitobacter marinus]
MFDQYFAGILVAFGVFVMGMFSPGPNIMSIIGTSMAVGRSSGKALALGIASGSFIWGTLTLFGLTALLTTYAGLLTFIKIAGACYLLLLAYKAFASALKGKTMQVKGITVDGGFGRYYRRGLLIQMTNPKAAFTWLAILSLALDQTAPFWVGGIVVAGTGIISIVGHLAYAIAFSTAPMVNGYRKAQRWIDGALGSFFTFASYKIATSDL